MRWQRKKNIWPYLTALSCLFLLSLFAPKTWLRPRNQLTQPATTDLQKTPIKKELRSGNFHSAQTEQQPKQVVRLEAERVLHLLETPSPHAMVPPELPSAAETNISQTAIVVSNEDYLLEEDTEEKDTYLQEPHLPGLVSPAVSEEVVLVSPPAPNRLQLDTLLSLRDSLAALVKQAATRWDALDPPQQVTQMDPTPLDLTDSSSLVDEFEPTKVPVRKVPLDRVEETGPITGLILAPPDKSTSLTIIPKQLTPKETHPKTEETSELDRRPTNSQVSILLHPLLKVFNENDRLAMLPAHHPSHAKILNIEPPLINSEPDVPKWAIWPPMATRPVKLPRIAQAPITPTPIISAPSGYVSTLPTDDGPIPNGAQANTLAQGNSTYELPTDPVSPNKPWLVSQPVALLNSLTRLEQMTEISYQRTGRMDASRWASEVQTGIGVLINDGYPVEDASAAISQLQQLVLQGENGAIQNHQASIHLEWLHTVRALQRRLGVWQLLVRHQDSSSQKSESPSDKPTLINYKALQQACWKFSMLTTDTLEGAGWREYLLHDSILEMALSGLNHTANKVSKTDRHWQRLLAQQVLARMSDPRLTVAQRQFLANEPVLTLRHQLQWWATGPVDLQRLAASIEKYELLGRDDGNQRVAEYLQCLKWSNDKSRQALAEQLDRHYRKANVRIVLTDKFINRLIPKQETTVSPIHDHVVGTEIRGSARTNTNIQVRLLPDSKVWRFSLEAHGDVRSRTHSVTWPARIHNVGKLQYQASKQIVLGNKGIQIAPANARASGRNRLVDVETPLDPVPVVNSLLHGWIRQQHKKTQPRALAQAKSKTANTVKRKMDRQVDEKLHQLEHQFRETVVAHLEQLSLVAEPIELYTTHQRAVMRLRLAGDDQLAAHSLRPLAPSDSWMSLQLHNSALNNCLAGFDLDGQRMSVGQLFDLVVEKLRQPDIQRPHDLPDRAMIEFACRDAICVDCRNGRLQLVLNIRELSYGRDKIRNFKVHAEFRPELNGLQVTLVRDGTLQFSGRRLLTGPRMVLHSIFGKLLRKDQQLLLLGEKIQHDPRLNGLMITQLTLDHGWIGVAWGQQTPQRVAWRSQ